MRKKLTKLGDFIQKRLKELGISRYALAKKVGLSEGYLRYLEVGERKPKPETLKRIADGLDVPFKTLAELAEMPLIKMHRVPVLSWASVEKWGEVIEEVMPEGWIEVDIERPNLFALRVYGDSMEPEFTEGEIIVVDTDATFNSGDFVIVRNSHGEVSFKQAKKYGDIWILRPLNPKYPEIEMTGEHRYIGKVIRKIKMY